MKNWKSRITYKNKTYFQVEVLQKRSKLNIHEADRIKVSLVSKEHKDNNVFYIHALEAIDLIYLLSGAVAEVVVKELPLASRD